MRQLSRNKPTAGERFRRTVAGRTSGTLAYTCLCLVTLIFAVCLEKMPEAVLERVHALLG